MFSNVVGLHLRVSGGRHLLNPPTLEIEEDLRIPRAIKRGSLRTRAKVS